MLRTETKRQAAHVFLDVISAFDDLSNPDPDPAMRLAFRRLEEIDGAVTLTYDDETDIRKLDIQPILHAAMCLLIASIVDHIDDVPSLDSMTAIERLRRATDLAFGTPE